MILINIDIKNVVLIRIILINIEKVVNNLPFKGKTTLSSLTLNRDHEISNKEKISAKIGNPSFW